MSCKLDVGNGVFNSIILGYMAKTSSIQTSPLGLTEILITLKKICNTKLGFIQRTLRVIIK